MRLFEAGITHNQAKDFVIQPYHKLTNITGLA